MAEIMNRERWLAEATDVLRADFEAIGAALPDNIRVSCGWPKGVRGGKRKAVGQCFAPEASTDNRWNVFISPVLDDAIDVLGTHVHELVHVAVGLKHGHGGRFKTLALAIGLVGKMTATTVGERLFSRLTAIAEELGPYPHGALDDSQRKKQSTRLLKAWCPFCDKEGQSYIVRLTAKVADRGAPICGACHNPLTVERGE